MTNYLKKLFRKKEVEEKFQDLGSFDLISWIVLLLALSPIFIYLIHKLWK